MSTSLIRQYRFSSPTQWSICCLSRVEPAALAKSGQLQPPEPYDQSGIRHRSTKGRSPVITRGGDLFWQDDDCRLHWLSACSNAAPQHVHSPFSKGRVVANAGGLWVFGDHRGSLVRHDDETLSGIFVVHCTEGEITDIASDGADGVYALTKVDSEWRVLHVSASGHVLTTAPLHGIDQPSALVYLRHGSRFVVLAGRRQRRLFWFDAQGKSPSFSIPVASMRGCFEADALGSDGVNLVFLAGRERTDRDEKALVLILDAGGETAGEIALEHQATGLAAWKDSLLVTDRAGAVLFTKGQRVAASAGITQFTVFTPSLHSPDREDRRRWSRAEIRAKLPAGSTLEVRALSTSDPETRKRVDTLVSDSRRPGQDRIDAILREDDLDRERVMFTATDDGDGSPRTFAAKLFDIRDPYVWIMVTIRTSPGGALPMLEELVVLYPGRSLIENLPAIYRADEEEPQSFTRSLVGILETTTQGIDRHIQSFGSLIHPESAPVDWLNFVARWLGLPWDDALDETQKRALVRQASTLARARGTREGLETFLESLLPGTPRRYRVTDATADHGLAVLGGGDCPGTALPALLGGFATHSARLGVAALGRMQLPRGGQQDSVARLTGRVVVEIAATALERKKWRSWLRTLLVQLMPVTARLQLRWVSAYALRGDRLDESSRLETAPPPHLGTDAITGVSRFPDRPARLGTSGQGMNTRMR